MKNLLIILALGCSFYSKADQLAYISEAEAKIAVQKINKLKYVYLFCGCCSVIKPEKVKVVKVYEQDTGYENYHEVYLECIKEDGTKTTVPLDLAYVWKKGFFGAKTIGKMLGLEHDPCVPLSDWNNPKYLEKDI